MAVLYRDQGRLQGWRHLGPEGNEETSLEAIWQKTVPIRRNRFGGGRVLGMSEEQQGTQCSQS